jgi:hypothetical protein
MEKFHSKKLNDAEIKEQYHVKISNRFAALENLMMMMMWTSLGLGKVLERIQKL